MTVTMTRYLAVWLMMAVAVGVLISPLGKCLLLVLARWIATP